MILTEELPYQKWRDIYEKGIERAERLSPSFTLKIGGIDIYVDSSKDKGFITNYTGESDY